MDKILSKNRRQPSKAINANIGRQVLDIITSGMYNNPLMSLREYIQNAADSIDEAIDIKRFRLNNDNTYIKIDIDKELRTITVTDNGTGIPFDQVEQRLGSIGFSLKEKMNQRGFRGIGRLGGLGYCDSLKFETRSSSKKPVTIVEWDGQKFQKLSQHNEKKYDLKETIKKIARIRIRPSITSKDPSHFFRVTMQDVHRFHSDLLMDIKTIRSYLSQVAPLPYEEDGRIFRYGRELNDYFSQIPNYKTYNIYLNGEKLIKPYATEFKASKTGKDYIKSIKKIPIKNPDTGDIISLGWVALTSFKSSLPKSLPMRSIRVRHGNIEVGDERFLEHIYTERRFSSWHIGEFHLNHNIKPNARRDGFEQNDDYERFLARIKVLGMGLSKLCRESSRIRGLNRSYYQQLTKINNTIRTSFVDREHCSTETKKAMLQINEIEEKLKVRDNSFSNELNPAIKELSKIKKQIRKVENKSTFLESHINAKRRHIGKNGKLLISQFCRKIIQIHDNKKPIQKVLEEALQEL